VAQVKLSLRVGISASVSTAVVLLISRSVSISLAFGILASAIAFLAIRTKNNINEAAMTAAWPEVIDHLMSGIQSGLSLTESLAGLSTRGPDVLRPAFTQFKATLYGSGDVGQAIQELKSKFAHHGSDQIFEALIISKALGGSELLQILRSLGDFHLSAIAPWVLLLMLSTQPSTAAAYSTATGAVILGAGLVMTGIAYFWMNRLGRLPQTPRVFVGGSR
jgi:tight adherence protein B